MVVFFSLVAENICMSAHIPWATPTQSMLDRIFRRDMMYLGYTVYILTHTGFGRKEIKKWQDEDRDWPLNTNERLFKVYPKCVLPFKATPPNAPWLCKGDSWDPRRHSMLYRWTLISKLINQSINQLSSSRTWASHWFHPNYFKIIASKKLILLPELLRNNYTYNIISPQAYITYYFTSDSRDPKTQLISKFVPSWCYYFNGITLMILLTTNLFLL